MSRLVTGALLVASLCGTARADPPADPPPPDPAAVRAGDANLVSNAARSGFSFTFSAHGSLIVGTGSHGDVGNGPGVSLRLGHTMTPDTVFTVEIANATLLHERDGMLFTNKAGAIVFGAQHWVKESLWIRGGLGAGGYQRLGVLSAAGGEDDLGGPVALVGIGIDAVRFTRHLTLDVEVMSWMMMNKGGATTFSGLGVGLSYF